jgi:hypothetical protein
VEHLVVEEEEGATGLTSILLSAGVLGGCGDVLVDSEPGEEGLDFGGAHFGGVAEFLLCGFVEVDVAFDPAQISLLGAGGIVFATNRISHKIEKFRRLRGRVRV